jgi:50S ribosomal subunit-associated GTPase HflX
VGDEVLEGLGVGRDSGFVVLNKVDLMAASHHVSVPLGRRGVTVSAVTGEGLEGLRDAIRGALLNAPGVAFLSVPLDQSEMVERAVKLPHQLARRFRDRSVELAMRIDGRRLREAGLDGFRVSEWQRVEVDGGR